MTSNGFKHGSNIVAKIALLELGDFVSAEADQVGLQLLYSEFSGFDGEISDNPIGVHLVAAEQSTYDFFACIDNVSFIDNQLNFDSTTLAVPDPAALFNSSADAANCPVVQ